MYSGIDSQGFILGNGRNYNIHDNVIYANLSQITNRQHAKSAIGLATTGGTLYVRNNTVYGEGQFGIAVSTKRAFPMTVAEVSGNTMRINGLTTNPYQLVVRGFSQKYQGVSLKIFNNRIDTPGNVSNRGVIFDGIDAAGDGTDGMKFYNNYIDTKEHGNPEYGDAGWTHGFRMRDPDYMIPETKFFNNEFYNNTFKTVAFYNSDTDNGDAISIRITLRNGLPIGEQPNVFHDNTIISQTLDPTKVATTIGLEGHDSAAGTIFRNNTITSDTNLLRVTWQGGSGVLFDSNTFQKGTNATNFHPVSYGNAGTSTNTIFLDSTIGSGVDFTVAEQTWMGDCCSPDNQRGDRAYYVKWSLSLTVNDGGGTPIAGASVTIKDKNNSTVFTGTTDSFGNVSTPLSEYYWRQTPTYPIPPPTVTTYNPYLVVVSAIGHTTQTQSVTMNGKKSLTIVMP